MITWTPVTNGITGPVSGSLGDGEDCSYLVTEGPGGKITLARISADHWAAGNVRGIVSDIAWSITEVTSTEEGQRIAGMYEAGLDDPDRPAWQHIPQPRP